MIRKQKQNEQGYALVTVLLMVTIFMVVFSSFMGQALSNMKQNEVVEEVSTSVAVAEMGVSHYQVKIQNAFENSQQEIAKTISTIFVPTTPIDAIQKKAAEEVARELREAFTTSEGPIPIEGNPKANFTLSNFTANAEASDPKKVKITFDILGKENLKPTKLKATMYINLHTINKDPNSLVYDPSYDIYTEIKIPEGTAECWDLGNCGNILYNKGTSTKSLSGNHSFSNNQIIYTNSPLTIDGNHIGDINPLSIHAAGNITLEKNMKAAKGLILETKGGLTVLTNMHFEIYDNSMVSILGNATGINKLSIDASSKMCVDGDLDASNLNGVVGTLLVTGKVNNNPTHNYKPISYSDFQSKCRKVNSFGILWGSDIGTNINDVDY